MFCVIPDIHGRDFWELIKNNHKRYDKIIFLGDYFDSKEIDVESQIKNFKRIVSFKLKHPEKVELLLGNHDLHYLKCWKEIYTGFNFKKGLLITELLEKFFKKDLFKLVFKKGDFLISHAGVTNTWLKEQLELSTEHDLVDIDIKINNLLKDEALLYRAFKFQEDEDKNTVDKYGNNIYQGPTIIRPESLNADCLNYHNQIVGHTTLDEITIRYINKKEKPDAELIFIDNRNCAVLEINDRKEYKELNTKRYARRNKKR